MATIPIPENWGKCNFVYTEINHDLNPPVYKKDVLENPKFIDAIKSGLDEGPFGCSTATQFDFRDDPGVVAQILGMTLDQVNSDTYLKPDVETTIPVLSKMNNTNTQSVRVTGTLYKEKKVATAASTTYSNSLINQLFSPPAIVKPDNIYFIIDSGDELIARYLKPLSPVYPVNLHVIHSMTTIGDSAPKKKPNAKDWNSNNLKVLIHSWYFNKPIIIPKNHDDFMSNYLITCRLINAIKWHIGQTWSIVLPTGASNIIYNTNDSHVDNKKNAVRDELRSLIDSGTLNYAMSPAKKQEFALSVQKKRSGDHLQIIFAKEFPKFLADTVNDANFIYYAGKSLPTGTSGSPRNGLNEAEIKSRTYFVTGDWPAFCYACYLGVNSIMVARTSGYVLRAWFS